MDIKTKKKLKLRMTKLLYHIAKKQQKKQQNTTKKQQKITKKQQKQQNTTKHTRQNILFFFGNFQNSNTYELKKKIDSNFLIIIL